MSIGANKYLKLLKENIPLFTSLFLCLALIKLHIYYNFFNIDIYQFISISEVLKYFIKFSIESFIFLALIALSYASVYVFVLLKALSEYDFEKEDIPILLKKYLGKVFLPIGFLILSLALIPCSIFLILYSVFVNLEFGLFYSITFTLTIIISYKKYKFITQNDDENISKSKNLKFLSPEKLFQDTLWFLCFNFLLYILITPLLEVFQLSKSYNFNTTIIEYKDSNSTLAINEIYIGKTEKFIFIYDTEFKESKAIKMEDVSELRMTNANPERGLYKLLIYTVLGIFLVFAALIFAGNFVFEHFATAFDDKKNNNST